MEADVLTRMRKIHTRVVSFGVEKVSNGIRREDREPASAGAGEALFSDGCFRLKISVSGTN
jgi:hypothetical protein